MDILINERSFIGQARYYDVRDHMRVLAETVEALRPICQAGQVLIHSSLIHQPLTDVQTLRAWLSTEDYRREDTDLADLPLQALIIIILDGFSRGPYIDELIADMAHLCTYQGEDVEGSALAGAVCFNGVLVSLGGCPNYIDGPLEVSYCTNDGPIEQRVVAHFTNPRSARRCRRRYVPNPKHHPARADGNVAIMLLDTVYDPFDDAKQSRLRDPELPLPDTEAQHLLDGAEPGGKQLYARTYNHRRRVETFYEFQDDNTGGFHGYPVAENQVPANIVQRLRNRED